jgi:hypothetical protein
LSGDLRTGVLAKALYYVLQKANGVIATVGLEADESSVPGNNGGTAQAPTTSALRASAPH